MKNAKRLLCLMMLFTTVACNDNGDVKMDMVEMPVTIAIPASGFSSPTDTGIDGEPAEGRETRAPGDPGTDEQFDLPQFIHVYLVTNNNGVSNATYTKFAVSKEDWKLVTADDNENDHFSGVMDKEGLYVYQGHLTMSLPAKREQGRVYIAACDADLERFGLNKTIANPAQVPEQATIKAGKELSPHMKNLYSTPYNLLDAGGQYYGTIEDFAGKAPHLDIVLYHTATKVDVQWQIDEDCQGVKAWQETNTTDMSADGDDAGQVFFSGIELLNLPETCPLFRPMDCRASVYGTASYTVPLHTDKPEQKGQRYNGRSVVYAIPRRYPTNGFDYFMGIRMQANGYAAEGKGHHAYIQIQDEDMAQADGSPIYTPWLRAFVHVTKDNVGNLVQLNKERQYENIR